jgi:hypothetical protein
MDAKSFERSLRGLTKRLPFKPFTVEFVSGERTRVDHPEALLVRAGVAVFLSAKGVPSWFDHEGVSRFVWRHG